MGKVNWTFEKVFGEVAKTGCKLITKEYKNTAFLRNSNGRLDFPGPTQEAS